MQEKIIQLITQYGLESVVIGLIINFLTGIIKLPIKALASKLKDSTKVTRFIVFLPIALGFLIAFLYSKFIKGDYQFNREFATLWLTSSSLSLTFYAIFEKIFPSKKKLLNNCEIETGEKILQSVTQLVDNYLGKETNTDVSGVVYGRQDSTAATVSQRENVRKKIILKGTFREKEKRT